MHLAVVSLIHPKYQGEHDPGESYLVEETFAGKDINYAQRRAQWYATQWKTINRKVAHPHLRSFWKHAVMPQLHIIEERVSSDGAEYAVPKTFWLKLLQRRWRMLLKQKQDRLVELSSVTALEYYNKHNQVIPTQLKISSWWQKRYSWMAGTPER